MKERSWGGYRTFTLIELVIVIAIIAIVAAIAIPNMMEARKHANEVCAIGALKTLTTAQRMFRDGDKDGNGTYDYGDLTQLAEQNLVDDVLKSGTKQGFVFETRGATTALEFLYYSIANPQVLGSSGDRGFATNHLGAIFYTSNTVVPNTIDASIPPGMAPIK